MLNMYISIYEYQKKEKGETNALKLEGRRQCGAGGRRWEEKENTGGEEVREER